MVIVDYYQVVAVTAKMITVRKIASKIESGNGMRGTSVPVPDAFVQKPHHWQATEFKRKVLPGGYINIDSVSCAHKWNGKPLYHDHMD